MARAPREWAGRFFREPIFSPGMPEAAAKAAREAAFAARALRLRPGRRLLDLCCGTGRHSVALARRGVSVVGLDATPAYLEQARRAAARLPAVRFVRGDMRRLAFRAEFDAAINLWTSFGYFPELASDRRVLRGVARALKPGGLFLIDLVSGDYLLRRARERFWAKRSDGAYQLEELRARGGGDPAHVNTWTILRPGRRPVSATFFLRLYTAARLSRELRRAGLVPARRWGGLDGRRWTREASRLVILARKPSTGSGR